MQISKQNKYIRSYVVMKVAVFVEKVTLSFC